MNCRFEIITLLMLCSLSFFGQSMSYTLFKGKVYKYPNSRKYISFEEDYDEKYPLLNELSWESIHVEQRDTDEGFPDVSRDGAFGIMFKSVLTVDETSMYRFAITSDDGSILWIDDELIIDNDYSNGMHLKADTLALRPGDYNIKLWYYQAYPTMFGFIFESEPVAGDVVFDIDTITLDQDLLFNTGSSILQRGANQLLDSLGTVLLKYQKADVSIVGHTDNIGTEEMNISLSEARANRIRDYLLLNVDHIGVRYITRGQGASMPIDTNESQEGRAKNRRVEILVEGY